MFVRSPRPALWALALMGLMACVQPAHSARTVSETRSDAQAATAARKTPVPPKPLVLDAVDDSQEARTASDGKDPRVSKAPEGAYLAAGGVLGLAVVSLLLRRIVSRRMSS